MISPSRNRVTEYRHNGDGRLTQLIARNGETGDQVTEWEYGTTLGESGVASFDLVRRKVYPEGSGGSNGVMFRHDRLGELTGMTDQNGTEHAYDYDRLGRPLHDRVTALGSGIDGAVRRISRSYDRAGRLESVGSWSEAGAGAGQVVNQLRLRYNGFGQLIEDSQSHDGAVAPGSTPAVRYQYANGSNRHIRRLKTTYPGGREIEFDYGAAGEADDKLGRVQAIRDGSDADKVLARYTRRGLSATMRIEYPTSTEVYPVEMTYIKQPGEPNGDGGDQYTGQDRFNRIIDIRWLRTPTFHVDRFQYGFDRAGNRLWRRNVVAASNWDELYSYDGLYQLPERQRGTLNGTHTGLTGVVLDKEQFTYDPTGNWDRYLTQGTTTLDQSRTHNRANEITEIAGSEAAAGYDRAGNMTRMPRVWSWALPQETTWDAWNRLVKISEGATTVGRYAYDGLTRRVWKESVEDGTLTRRHFYYSDQWQVLEERTGTSVLADRRFVWGLRYIDDLILRDRVTSPTDTERLYVTHDQWHVTATVGTDGLASERYAYRAFGLTHVLKPDFSPRSASISGWETTYGAYRYDSEARLYCVRYRYLHSALGRWISRDPLGERGGVNLFATVGNRPSNFVDPFGLAANEAETSDNCFYIWIVVYKPRGENQARPVHASVGARASGSIDNVDLYGTRQEGDWKTDGTYNPNTGEWKGTGSQGKLYECCCLSNADLKRFNERLNDIKRGIVPEGSKDAGKKLPYNDYVPFNDSSPSGVDYNCATAASMIINGLGCASTSNIWNMRPGSVYPKGGKGLSLFWKSVMELYQQMEDAVKAGTCEVKYNGVPEGNPYR